MDNKPDRDERDRTRINPAEPYALQYWSKRLNITPEKLREVVERVGTSPSAVQKVLGK